MTNRSKPNRADVVSNSYCENWASESTSDPFHPPQNQRPDGPGRLRAWFNRHEVVGFYLGVGACFHVGTHLALQLGIFPFAVMSLYPACFPPDQIARAWRRLRPSAAAPS